MCDYRAILQQVLAKNPNAEKWRDASFEEIKRVTNTAVGKIGQSFVRLLCGELGLTCVPPYTDEGKEAYTSPWDLKIEGITFEIKTASEDTCDVYQFNHVRLHRDYDALLCIGISPEEVTFQIWTKSEVACGDAGTLTSMEKGGASDFKLSKRKRDMLSMTEFESILTDFLVNKKFPHGHKTTYR